MFVMQTLHLFDLDYKLTAFFYQDEEEEVKLNSMPAKSKRVPTGRIVGILRRKWRPYCGILAPSSIKEVVSLAFFTPFTAAFLVLMGVL